MEKYMDWSSQLSSVSVDRNHASTSTYEHKLKASSATICGEKIEQDEFVLKILSFNVLAEAYLSPRSHKRLPEQYAKVVFDRIKRKELLLQTLLSFVNIKEKNSTECSSRIVQRPSYDILCLQEVDMYEDIVDLLHEDFDSCHSKIVGRTDRCAIFWRRDEFELIRSEIVDFDDLGNIVESCDDDGHLKLNGGVDNDDDNSTKKKVKNGHLIRSENKKNGVSVTLSGMASSFRRRNTASNAILLHKKTNRKFVISSAHFYWNPSFEYVKLVQAKYLMDRLYQLVINHQGENCEERRIPIFVCGDFNAKPGSPTHALIVQGKVNSTSVAPWHYCQIADNDEIDEEEKVNNSRASGYTSCNKERNTVIEENIELREKVRRIKRIERHETTPSEFKQQRPAVKYMLDYTLNRFTRWFRILGLDAALETGEEEKERTRRGCKVIPIFQHCRDEGRVLISTSNRLLLRKDCPPAAYHVNPRHLEMALCHILLLHGIVLLPKTFLTRCVVCNGSIIQVDGLLRQEILEANKCHALGDTTIYACDFCLQSYWWSDEPGSSSSRVKNSAEYLFKLVLRAGVPYEGELGICNDIDVEAERMKKEPDFPTLKALEWLKRDELKQPLVLRSAYATDDDNVGSEILPFTNVTSDFVGTLDYIFFEPQYCTQIERLDVPKTFQQMNCLKIPNGHLIPSDSWPSDHIAIGATIVVHAVKKE